MFRTRNMDGSVNLPFTLTGDPAALPFRILSEEIRPWPAAA